MGLHKFSEKFSAEISGFLYFTFPLPFFVRINGIPATFLPESKKEPAPVGNRLSFCQILSWPGYTASGVQLRFPGFLPAAPAQKCGVRDIQQTRGIPG